MGLVRVRLRWIRSSEEAEMRRMRTIWIAAVGCVAAIAARQFMTSQSGLTYTGSQVTRYVPCNIVAFWLLLGVPALSCLVYLVAGLKDDQDTIGK
jgi:hypothetical protein